MSYPFIFGPNGEPAIGDSYFNGNGYGALSDCSLCTVTEQLNSEYELYIQYPISGFNYDKLIQRAVIRVVPNQLSEPQYFRVYQISKPINGLVDVYARHISYDLSGAIILPYSSTTCAGAISGIESHRIGGTEFRFWTDNNATGGLSFDTPTSLRSYLGGTDKSILGVYGGEFEWDNYVVKLHKNRGVNRGVTIRYGKNLTDLNQEENCSNCYTAVFPFWSGYSNDHQVLVKPDSPISIGSFSYVKILPLDCSSLFDSQPSIAALNQAAQEYIASNNIGIPEISLTVSFIQLSKTEEYKNIPMLDTIGLCDIVTVIFEELGVETTAEVVEVVYDCLLDRFETITLGNPTQNLERTLSNQQGMIQEITEKAVSKLDEAIGRATRKITGNLGGYVVIRDSDSDGFPDEILILDENSNGEISQSQHIWRWNSSGLGYSNDYGETYGLAMTADGEIVADFITTGNLDASNINVSNLNANSITSGTIDASRINVTNINASNIKSGSIDASNVNVTNINASNITTGSLSADRIQGGTIDANSINVQHLNAANLSNGYVPSSRISTSDNKLDIMYVKRLVVGDAGGSDYLDMVAKILWSSTGAELDAGGVIPKNGATKVSWTDICNAAGGIAKWG